MSAGSLSWLAPLVAAAITASFGYLVALRKTSGRIATTEASKLWEEAADLRGVYQLEIERLGAEISRCRLEIQELEARNRQLRAEVAQLERKNMRLQLRLEELEDGLTSEA